jgi:lipopolysaccharide assembly outer membrane protein LptD (OstA)
MTPRRKKLILIQISLLLIGLVIIFFTYSNQKVSLNKEIISKENQKKIKEQLGDKPGKGDVFYNIEYSGLDLAGNRYILKSKEAHNQQSAPQIINMKFVEAVFYFKDDTILYVLSDEGVYNNRSLDMSFSGNVEATYEGSELFAQKAEYSNSNSFLSIFENVIVKDVKGTMVADKLLFDIKKQTLNIAAFNDEKINANINIK